MLPDNSIAESLLDAKPTRVWRVFWTVTIDLAMIGIGVALAMLGPTLGDVARQINVDFVVAGGIFSFRAGGYLLGALVCGPMLDNFKNMALIFLVPLFLTTVGAFAVPCVTTFFSMCVLFVFQGLSMGMLDTGGNTLILTLWRDSKYQNGHEHAMHFFFGLGAAIAPQVVAFIIDYGYGGLHAWLFTAISLCPCCVGFLILVFTTQPQTGEEGRTDGAVSKTVLLTGAFLFVYVGMEVAYGGYISAFTMRFLEVSEVGGAHMTSIYWGMLCVGRFVAALITSHVNHTKYLAVHICMAAGAMVVLTMTNLYLGGSWSGTLVGTLLFGFALAPLFPGAMLLAEETLGRGMLGAEASIIVVLAALGESLCPGLIGLLLVQNTMNFGYAFLGLCGLSGMFFIAVLRSDAKASNGKGSMA